MSDPTYASPPPDRRVKVPHLVFGLLFLGLVAIWALGTSHLISGERLAVLGPAVLIAAGVVGLVASLASARSRRTERPYEPTYERPAEPEPELDDHTEEIR